MAEQQTSDAFRRRQRAWRRCMPGVSGLLYGSVMHRGSIRGCSLTLSGEGGATRKAAPAAAAAATADRALSQHQTGEVGQ